MYRSGLVARLERYLDLTPSEYEALGQAQHREVRLKSGEILKGEGGSSDSIYVVQRGWLHASARLPGGGRQILRFHHVGDLVGTSSIAWPTASTTLTAMTDCTVTHVPKRDLGILFRDQPRLAGLFYAIAAAENVAMSDRLTSVGRMGAAERLSTLLLDFLARVRVTAGRSVDSFELPLTQGDIGDAVGLTKVHVNRTIHVLERDGLIARDGRHIRILDEARMVRTTGFVDRYGAIDIEWLPPACEP